METESLWLTLVEASRYLSVREKSILLWIEEGKLKSYSSAEGSPLLPLEGLDEFRKNHFDDMILDWCKGSFGEESRWRDD